MRFRLAATIVRALECARTVVRDLDTDQVPARLRPVAAHAGDLTPPLADRLARELDRLDWLREKAAEQWDGIDPAADGPDRASALFLLRPEGWVLEFGRLIGERAAAGVEGATRADPRLERDLAAWREKARSATREVEALRRRVAELEQAAREPERSRAASAARDAEALAAARREHAVELAGLQERVAELEAEARAAKEASRRARRERADAQRRLDDARQAGAWVDRDPIELAIHLDAVAAQARPGRPHRPEEGSLPPPSLPAGVRPDSAAAIEALLRSAGPIAMFVDGYNAGLALFPTGSPGEVRRRLEDVLRRLRRLGAPGITVTVVWDSAGGDDGERVPDGLDVRFAPPGVPADDVLADLARSTDRAVVVTNDREVRERAAAAGALALWSTALVDWSTARR
jgi:hypothetical protein